MAKVKPILVLALIAALISGLVIVVHDLTYVDTSTQVTDKEAAALKQIYGSDVKDDYLVADPSAELEGEKTYKDLLKDAGITNVDKVFKKKDDGSLGIKCIVKGYKNGFEIMVGLKDGVVQGVAIVSVGEETPGLGTKTNDETWLARFKDITGETGVEIVKTATTDLGKVQAVTSATYSSKGVASAVKVALEAFPILNELPDELYNKEAENGGEAQ